MKRKGHAPRYSAPLGVVTIVCASFLASAPALAGARDTIQTNVPALKNVYVNDFRIGCILSYRHVGFKDDPPVSGQSAVVDTNGGALIRFHMNSMTPGNNMKALFTVDTAASAAAFAAATSQAQRDSIEVRPVVQLNGDMIAQLNWCQRQGFTVRGHTLIWHNQTPASFFRSGYVNTGMRLSKSVMIQRMDNYIHDLIGLIHEGWPGLLSAMDVVNEAVSDETGLDRTESEWYTTFGDNTYVMKAFESAYRHRQEFGETQMKLYYNEYNTEDPNKADGVVRICAPIRRAGYLDGIGIQGNAREIYPSAEEWRASYNKFDPVCSEMSITEYYTSILSANPSDAEYTAQANQYAMLFKCYLDRSKGSGRGKIVNVTKAGLNDKYDAFNGAQSGLWDSTDQCKRTYYAVANLGITYHALDSLIAYAEGLDQSEYTSSSWANCASALITAKSAMARDYSASVSAVAVLGQAKDDLGAALHGLLTGAGADGGNAPTRFSLDQNYPNPFNPATTIRFVLPSRSLVTLTAFNALGQQVAQLVSGEVDTGYHDVTFDGKGLSGGVYFYRMQAGDFVQVRKLVMLR